MDSTAILAANWLAIVAITGNLGLAILILRRGARNPLRMPLLLLVGAMTIWSFASAIYDVFGGAGWRWIDVSTSPLLIPLALHVVLSFVGRRRRHIVFLTGVYVVFGGLAVTGALWLAQNPSHEQSPPSQLWATFFLLGTIPPLLYAVYRLTKHARDAADPEEATRARMILAGLVVGLAFGSTELINNFYAWIPDLGHLGTLAVTGTLTVATLRFRLLDYEVAASGWLIGTTIALAVVSGYLLFFGTGRLGFALFVAAALAFVGVVGFREIVMAMLRRRERMEELATLGRFSAQMAHDLKNPLAALKGALQYLQVELASRADTEHDDVVLLMDEQIRRIEAMVDRYHRMSAVEPRRQPFDLKQVCERQVRAASLASPEVEFSATFGELDLCDGDEELITLVIENVVSNAADAMSSHVRLHAENNWGGLVLRIADDGHGMAVRDMERAFDDFYTTKATGTGLGLSFARRVMHAHGGRIDLESSLDGGTQVTLYLPTP